MRNMGYSLFCFFFIFFPHVREAPQRTLNYIQPDLVVCFSPPDPAQYSMSQVYAYLTAREKNGGYRGALLGMIFRMQMD